MPKTFAFALSVLLVTGAQANAQGRPEGSYFCSSEIAAGLKYDPSLKEWRSVTFKEKEKFVLKLRFVRAEQEVNYTVETYNLTITREGNDTANDCFAQNYGLAGDPREVQAHAQFRTFNCYNLFHSYRFNMKTNRFLSAYIDGYVDGDNNENTPSFDAGKCTKIN
jgi:hypothetical protein